MIGFALSATAACTENEREAEPYRLWVSPQFSNEQQLAVRRACVRWNEIAGRAACAVDGVGERERLVVRPAGFPIDGVDAQGWQAEQGVLLIAKSDYVCAGGETDIRCFEAIAMHEIGHLMGVKHVHRGVMQEFGARIETSDEDRAACLAAKYCGGLLHPEND